MNGLAILNKNLWILAPIILISVTNSYDDCPSTDSDSCLQSTPGWGSWYTCASSTSWCDFYAKDMKRCCPESCNSGSLTEVECNALNGYGSCIYPNDAQCPGKCLPKDSDNCLQTTWGRSYTCASSTDWCSSWGKDMRRCCPEACDSGVFTEEECNSFSGSGTCIYPNDAQCPEETSEKGENQCQDMGLNKKKFWVDKMKFSCELYEGADWCTPSKERGEGWNKFWGSFEGFKTEGASAIEACCACGGGIRNPKKFSNELPVYTEIKEYPYGDVDYRFTANDVANKQCYNCKDGMIWHDSWGYSCKAYHYGNFCTKDGKTGKGWDENQYGSIKSYKNAGKNAFQACGACKED